MEIVKQYDGLKLTVVLSGKLDTVTAPELEKELKNEYDKIESLIFDFKNLQYVSSAGLRIILSSEKIMKNKKGMVIKNVNDDVMDVFDITGFSDILTIE